MTLNTEEQDSKGLAVLFCKELEKVLEEDSCCWIECSIPSTKQLAKAFLKTLDLWEES